MIDAIAPPEDLEARAAEIGVAFDPGDVERLGRFLALLLETNRQFNLTGVTDPAEAWERHILDSLALMPYVAAVEATTLIDVGSGGGMPGLPLAIAAPDLKVTLLDATGKKTRFLEEAAAKLGLDNVTVVTARAEQAGQDERHRAAYDVVTARALGPLRVLAELTIPLARVGGVVLAIKGRRAEEEIAEAKLALHRLHATVTRTDRTPTGTVVALLKARPTPKQYPRRAGEPKRAPL